MKILKFGGTSVANSESLSCVLKIIQNQRGPISVVVSALGGVTDLLMEMLSLAQSGEDHYKDNLTVIEKLHLDTIKNCVPIQHQSAIISFLKKNLNELESKLDAIHLLEEVTPKNNSSISSYGEILSSNIIQEVFTYNKIDSVLKDSRELIKTSSHNGRDEVDQKITSFEVFNVGGDKNNFTKKQITEKIISHLPGNSEGIFFTNKKSDPRNYKVNFSKIEKKLNFRIKHTVSEGIEEIINYLKNSKKNKSFLKEELYGNYSIEL